MPERHSGKTEKRIGVKKMKQFAKNVELDNGAKGILIDVPDSSVVCFEFNFRAGDYLSPKGKMDTAHLMEHIALGANKKFKKASDYSKEFVKNGAYQNASTGSYHMTYIAECAEFEAERIIDLLLLAIEEPLFLEKEFKTEKENVREELMSRMNDHGIELSLISGEKMGLVEMPYRKRLKELDRIQLSDIKKHYVDTHTATNMRFIISGAIKNREKKLIKRLNATTLAKGIGRIPLVSETLHSLKKSIVVSDESVENIFYRWDSAIENRFTPQETQAFGALGIILLGTMHSRIYGKAREKGLVYGIDYSTYFSKDNQFFSISGEVSTPNINELFIIITKELKKMANGDFTEKELDEAKSTLLGDLQRRYQTAWSVLDVYASPFLYENRVENFDELPDRIKNITREAIIDIATKFLKKESKWVLAFYGNINEIKASELYAKFDSMYH